MFIKSIFIPACGSLSWFLPAGEGQEAMEQLLEFDLRHRLSVDNVKAEIFLIW